MILKTQHAFILLSALCILMIAADKKASSSKAIKGGYVTVDSTKFDFDEGMIEGRMKAPDGFFLRGRASQKLQQMVRLRSEFRSELKGSSFGVRALAK